MQSKKLLLKLFFFLVSGAHPYWLNGMEKPELMDLTTSLIMPVSDHVKLVIGAIYQAHQLSDQTSSLTIGFSNALNMLPESAIELENKIVRIKDDDKNIPIAIVGITNDTKKYLLLSPCINNLFQNSYFEEGGDNNRVKNLVVEIFSVYHLLQVIGDQIYNHLDTKNRQITSNKFTFGHMYNATLTEFKKVLEDSKLNSSPEYENLLSLVIAEINARVQSFKNKLDKKAKKK